MWQSLQNFSFWSKSSLCSYWARMQSCWPQRIWWITEPISRSLLLMWVSRSYPGFREGFWSDPVHASISHLITTINSHAQLKTTGSGSSENKVIYFSRRWPRFGLNLSEAVTINFAVKPYHKYPFPLPCLLDLATKKFLQKISEIFFWYFT